jgi:hypothetical protein
VLGPEASVTNSPEASPLPNRWLGAMCRHEGAPLALRVRSGVRSWRGRSELPYLLAVTLHLTEVRSDGLPAPEYNVSLGDLDHAMFERCEQDGDGVVVLIETFSGERTWYAYGRERSIGEAVLRDIEARFPGHRFTSRATAGAEWGLWDLYRGLFESFFEGGW